MENKENNKIETTKIHEPDSTNDVQVSPKDEGKKDENALKDDELDGQEKNKKK